MIMKSLNNVYWFYFRLEDILRLLIYFDIFRSWYEVSVKDRFVVYVIDF